MITAAIVIALGVLGCAAVVAQGPAPTVVGVPAEPTPYTAPAPAPAVTPLFAVTPAVVIGV